MKDYRFHGITITKVETATFESYDAKIKLLDPSYNLSDQYRGVYGDQQFRSSQFSSSISAFGFSSIPFGF